VSKTTQISNCLVQIVIHFLQTRHFQYSCNQRLNIAIIIHSTPLCCNRPRGL